MDELKGALANDVDGLRPPLFYQDADDTSLCRILRMYAGCDILVLGVSFTSFLYS